MNNRMNRNRIVVHIYFLRARNFKFAAPSRFDIGKKRLRTTSVHALKGWGIAYRHNERRVNRGRRTSTAAYGNTIGPYPVELSYTRCNRGSLLFVDLIDLPRRSLVHGRGEAGGSKIPMKSGDRLPPFRYQAWFRRSG